MSRRRSSDAGGGGCAWGLLLVIACLFIGYFYGAGFAFTVFCMVILFTALT